MLPQARIEGRPGPVGRHDGPNFLRHFSDLLADAAEHLLSAIAASACEPSRQSPRPAQQGSHSQTRQSNTRYRNRTRGEPIASIDCRLLAWIQWWPFLATH